jgi:hypothetical protein
MGGWVGERGGVLGGGDGGEGSCADSGGGVLRFEWYGERKSGKLRSGTKGEAMEKSRYGEKTT